MDNYQLIGPFTQVVTMSGHAIKGSIKDEALNLIENAGILIHNKRIKAIDDFEKLYKSSKPFNPLVTKLNHPQVALPGMIDCHTHICFSGSRAKDYALRNSGKTYLEIAKAGGGIWDTVQHTRAASLTALTTNLIKRINYSLNNGITTIEVKSGYGLSIQEELKMLEAIQLANKKSSADLISTCLAAHIFPKDYNGEIQDYLEEMSQVLFPLLKEKKLSSRIDAFVEEEAFSPEVLRPYLTQAKQMGFDITLHADQFHTGGTQLAIDFQAISADHLEASTPKEITLLAKSEVIAVALPGASIGIGCPFTPARKLLDAGVGLAIASDWNPGSAPMGHLLTQAAILGTFEKLSNAEVLAGITFRAATALNLKDRGKLQENYIADLIAFPTNDYQEILYHQGQLLPDKVWKEGIEFNND